MTRIPAWEPEYPGAFVYPAAESNAMGAPTFPPTHIVIHTPEEEADNYFATPVYFAQEHPETPGSTNAALSFFGFVTECVPPTIAPIANGVIGKPYPPGADSTKNFNRTTRSIEVEGRAATIGQTMPRGSGQWIGLVKWCAFQCRLHGLTVDRIIGHFLVATNRSDPGTLNLNWLREDVQALLEDDMDEATLRRVVREELENYKTAVKQLTMEALDVFTRDPNNELDPATKHLQQIARASQIGDA